MRPARAGHPVAPTARVVILLALAAVIASASPAVAGDDPVQKAIQENTAKLKKLRDEITADRNRIAALDDRQDEVTRSLAKIRQDIELSRKLLASMEERERVLREQAALLEQELASSIQAFAGRRETLAASLRAMYMRGDQGELEGILTAASFSDMVTRMKMQRMLTRLEANLVAETREHARTILRDRKQQEAALAEIARSRLDMDAENDRLEMLLAEQQAALRDLKDQRRDIKDRLLELGMNEQKLTYVLADLDKQRRLREQEQVAAPAAGALTTRAGKLEWPVRGSVLRGYGRSVHPQFKTVTLNNGVNIAAPEGSAVAAVAAGTVEFRDRLPGFGLCVILDHGEGYYTLYAYLERVFVAAGAKVAQGQIIAEVGRPSDGEPPQLYFEIRKGRTPLDPAEWLRPR